ncbi:MAG: hypothetical protein P8R38_02365 [Planctomycetota bacterium]|nr:hypothetical protein [Planctomycetota bacterium]
MSDESETRLENREWSLAMEILQNNGSFRNDQSISAACTRIV